MPTPLFNTFFVIFSVCGLTAVFANINPEPLQIASKIAVIEEPLVEQPQPTIQVVRAKTYIQHVNKSLPDEDAVKFATYVVNYASAFKLDLPVFLALLRVESTFKPESLSSAGAVGLAQVVPKWHQQRIKEARTKVDAYSLYEPRLNLYVGAWVLREYIDQSAGNIRRGLLRYNGSLDDPEQKYAHMVLAEAQYVRRAFLN